MELRGVSRSFYRIPAFTKGLSRRVGDNFQFPFRQLKLYRFQRGFLLQGPSVQTDATWPTWTCAATQLDEVDQLVGFVVSSACHEV